MKREIADAELPDVVRAWFEHGLARCARAHGVRWPEREQWVRDYMLEEIRQRLAARGWRKVAQ